MQDTRQQVLIALRWLPLILIGALGAAGLAYMVVDDQPRVYEATARLVVNPGQDPTVQNLELAASAATRYADQALSRGVIEAVIEDVGSTETFGEFGRAGLSGCGGGDPGGGDRGPRWRPGNCPIARDVPGGRDAATNPGYAHHRRGEEG